MGCEDRQELLSAYLDGELTVEEKRGLVDHLNGCGTCREILGGLRSVKASLKALKAPEAPSAHLWSRLNREILKRGRRRWVSRLRKAGSAVAAAVVLVFSFLTLLGYLSSPGPNAVLEPPLYLGNHAYHVMHRPLADPVHWSYVAGDSGLVLAREKE